MSIFLTLKETGIIDPELTFKGYSTWNLSIDTPQQNNVVTVNSDFKLSDIIDAKVKVLQDSFGKNNLTAEEEIHARFTSLGTPIAEVYSDFFLEVNYPNFVYNKWYTLHPGDVLGPSDPTISLSSLFNRDTDTVSEIGITVYTKFVSLDTGNTEYISGNKVIATDYDFGTVRLDAPPTFDTSVTSSGPYYRNLSTFTCRVSNLDAKYGGRIVSVALWYYILDSNGRKVDSENVNTIYTSASSVTISGKITNIIESSSNSEVQPYIMVVDSRGQTTIEELPVITVIPYSVPEINSLDANRCDGNRILDEDGTNGLIELSYTLNSLATSIDKPTVLKDGVVYTSHITWYDFEGSQITFPYSYESNTTIYGFDEGALNPKKSYSYNIRITDNLGGASNTVDDVIPLAFYTIDVKAGGHGIAFGGVADKDGFYCAMPASFNDISGVKRSLLDLIYPVGSYLWTSDPDFDPNVVYGKLWEKMDPGITLVSAGTGYTVKAGTSKDGGEQTVALKTSELPSHNHGERSLQGSFKVRHYGTSGTGAQIVYTPSGMVSINTDSTDVGKINQGGTSGGRSEDVTINATHTHDNVGNGIAHENMPPYKAAYCWHRLAPIMNVHGSWVETDQTHDGYKIYRSEGSYNISKEWDTVKLTFSGRSEFSIGVRSYGEDNYDYLLVSELNDDTLANCTQSSDIRAKYNNINATRYHTRGNPSPDQYELVTYSGLDPSNLYYIYVIYQKDGSTNKYDDRGYFYIVD